jgi:hypothetical protein
MKAGGLVLLITAFALCFKSRAKKLPESTGAHLTVKCLPFYIILYT